MRITYQAQPVCDFVNITTAKCQIALFGRWCEITLNCYSLADNEFDLTGFAIGYGIKPLLQQDLRCSSFDAVIDGVVKLSRGSGGNRQYFEQIIDFPPIGGQLLSRRILTNGGVGEARNLIGDILREFESIVETIRQHIRYSLSESVRPEVVKMLQNRFGEVTVRNLRNFLGQLHWPFLLSKVGCDEGQVNCIEAMSRLNPPRFVRVDFEGNSEIPLVGQVLTGDIVRDMRNVLYTLHCQRREAERQRKLSEANARARLLLESVCGSRLAQEYDAKGFITIEQSGYTFEIQPRAFIRCVDPNGKRGELCIHTQGLTCNPLDEVAIAYLYIRHNLAEYMRTAHLQRHEPGFMLPKMAA